MPDLDLVNTTKSVHGSDVTSLTLNMPTGTGGLLMAFVACGRSSQPVATLTWPAGWGTVLLLDSIGVVGGHIRWRIADGSEVNGVITTGGINQRAVVRVWRIAGASFLPPEIASAKAASINDPPLLTPTWGAKATRWIAFYADMVGALASGYPAGYTEAQDSVTVGGNCAADGICSKVTNAASDNPGAFTLSGGNTIVATVGIALAGGGAGGGGGGSRAAGGWLAVDKGRLRRRNFGV